MADRPAAEAEAVVSKAEGELDVVNLRTSVWFAHLDLRMAALREICPRNAEQQATKPPMPGALRTRGTRGLVCLAAAALRGLYRIEMLGGARCHVV